MKSKFCSTIGGLSGPWIGAPRLPRTGSGEVTNPLGLRLIVGSVAEGGGGADWVDNVVADVEEEAAGAAVANPAKRRASRQEVRLIIMTNAKCLRNAREPFIPRPEA